MKKRYASLLIIALLAGCDVSSLSSDVSLSSLTSETSVNNQEHELNFFAINDFHGAIYETDTDPGIFKLASYLKAQETQNSDQTVFINNGDYWQGSIDSNSNRGKFLTEAGNLLNFSSLTLGNHEFDWYDKTIENNKQIANYPFLGANIFNKATNDLATNIVSYDDSFGASTMVTKNGVDIGIIGTMGSSLESSILGTAIAPYYFDVTTEYIKQEVLNLEAAGAEVIVLATHDSLYGSFGEYQEIINQKLVDVIFSGHQHVRDNRVVNGIPILQTNGYGRQVMEVRGSYNYSTDKFSLKSSGLVEASAIKTYGEDSEMKDLFTVYEQEVATIKNEVIGETVGHLSTTKLAKMAVQVMHDNFSSSYSNVIAVHNYGGVRSQINSGTVIFGDVYRSFPFDNEIRIIENVPTSAASAFIGSNASYPLSRYELVSNSYYTIVTIDYLSEYEYSALKNYEQKLTGEFVRDYISDLFRQKGVIDASLYS